MREKIIWVTAVLVAVFMTVVNGNAAQIFYESFEDPVISSETNTIPTGWVQLSTGIGMGVKTYTGKESNQYARVAGIGEAKAMMTSSAILSSNLMANYRYTLTCNAAWNETRSGDVVMQLIAGSTVIAGTTNTVVTYNNFNNTTPSITFVTPAGHPNIGEMLAVSLWRTNGWGNSSAYFDNLSLDATDTSSDTTPPSPTNMVWEGLPTSSVSNSITMSATNAIDVNLVQYFFTNTVNGNVSGWQDSAVWTDTNLTPGVTYSYKVKARDKSANTNDTNWSAEESAECEEYIILYESFEEPSILPSTRVSFENPPLPPAGWDYNIGNSLDVWHDDANAVSTPYGQQYVAMRESVNSITAANLGHVLQAEYTYRVTFNSGGMDGSATIDKPATNQVELWAGSTLVASSRVSVTKSDLSETNSLVFIPDAANTNLGDAISLKLWVVKTPGPPGSWNNRGQFDNVKFYAIPPPAAGTMFVFQ